MPRASFYFNVRNREQALCQLLGKGLQQGLSMAVVTDSPAASQVLDRFLWEFPPTGFLPHCAADHPLATETPILLDHRSEKLQARDVLFSWQSHAPLIHARFGRIIELVAQDDPAGREAARNRVASYRAAGFDVDFTDMDKPGADKPGVTPSGIDQSGIDNSGG